LPQRAGGGALQNGWDRNAMARGHKTGGRQKGTPNEATARLAAKFAEAAGRATTGLSPSEIASMMPVDVMLFAMRLELECGQLRSAAAIAEKAAPYIHPKMAPRAEKGGDRELTIKIIGGLPE
jgi:hypothetical protein